MRAFQAAYEVVEVTELAEPPVPLVHRLRDLDPSRSPATDLPPIRPLFARPAPAAARGAPPSTVETTTPPPDLAAQAESARLQAERDGLRNAREKVEMVIERYLEGLSRLHDAIRRVGRPSADEVVSLALVVARELIGHELAADRRPLIEMLEKVLDTVKDEAPIVVRMGSADLSYVKLLRPDLLETGISLVEDRTLGIGGCVVETPRRVVDASLEARIQAVRGSLVALLAEAASSGEATGGEGQGSPPGAGEP